MLVGKPRKGDEVFYKGKLQGHVLRVDGNLCWVHYLDGEEDPFIWHMGGGKLNSLHDWTSKNE